ncbi:hypothetical protein [Flavobacterium caeni]|uniref:Mannitol repressor n=1 Tax=Flavobacterium caeni TaxID=490189 RepID=A0A1G5KDX4_9FLAO|nr:hypothetical protein [Flavobacterium caeni]SCY98802.1 hypothetical protein SAMN02927903_03255 [Flavobacterium caeni]
MNLNAVSKAENLRLYILEHTLIIEESISEALGSILNIEWEKSISFGHGSSSLSFNQKVQIIQDLKGIDKDRIQKLTDLMVIRNKFAHVKSIETFENLFEISSGKNVKKNLDKYYSDQIDELDVKDEETKYKAFFFLLFFDIIVFLSFLIGGQKREQRREKEDLEILLKLKVEVIKTKYGKKLLSKILTETNKSKP